MAILGNLIKFTLSELRVWYRFFSICFFESIIFHYLAHYCTGTTRTGVEFTGGEFKVFCLNQLIRSQGVK